MVEKFVPTLTPEQQQTSRFLSEQFDTFNATLEQTPNSIETAGAFFTQETIVGSLFEYGIKKDKYLGTDFLFKNEIK